MTGGKPDCPAAVSKSQAWRGKPPCQSTNHYKHFGPLVVCYQNQIVPTQEAPPRPGVLRTLNATRGLGSVTVENLAAGMDTNGIGGHEREGLGAMTAIGRGLAAGRLTTDRESEAVHPKPESTEGGRLVSILKWPEGAPLNLG